MSVILEFYLMSSSVFSASTAYTSLWRGLRYLLKVRYIILNYHNLVGFLIFGTLCLGSSKTLPYFWKKYHKNEKHLCLVTHIFIKLSQNVCLINKHILIHRYTLCNCKLWKALWFFFLVFSYIIDDSCLKCKYLHQTSTDCMSD